MSTYFDFFKLKSTDSVTRITNHFLKLLNVKFLKSDIEAKLLEHPHYPSMVSIIDTLESYGVTSYPVQISINEIEDIDEPFIAHTQILGEDHLVVVISIQHEVVQVFNELGKTESLSVEDFKKRWTGTAIFGEVDEILDNKNIKYSIQQSRANKVLLSFVGISLILFIPLWFVIAPVYLIAKVFGLSISIILLWYEIDRFNPVLQSICSVGKKVNCARVINSKGSKVFQTFTLTEISFSYFAGGLLFLLFGGVLNPNLNMLFLISVLSTPILFYSLYYQHFIVKQWCFLCLLISLVLITEILFSLSQLTYPLDISAYSILLLLFSYALPLLSWRLLHPVFLKAKEYRFLKMKQSHFKANSNVFFGLMNASDEISTPHENIGITVGNPEAEYNVIKVCNPFCPPCALAHPILENLIEESKISVQIIFTIPYNINHKRIMPARHLLAIAEKNEPQLLKAALDDWYLADKKEYDAFAKKYPLTESLDKQTPKIIAMKQWCKNHNITHTPTLFLNNRKLPNGYSAYDLRNIL